MVNQAIIAVESRTAVERQELHIHVRPLESLADFVALQREQAINRFPLCCCYYFLTFSVLVLVLVLNPKNYFTRWPILFVVC